MKQYNSVNIWDEIANSLEAIAEGKTSAWSTLLEQLEPEIDRIARYQKIGRLRTDEDAIRDIVTKVIARLHAGDYRAVKKLFALDEPPKVKAWMRVLVRSAAIDVMRAQPEFLRANKKNSAGWISLDTLVTVDGVKTPDSLVAKQREVEQFMARASLDARSAIAEHGDDAASALAELWKIAPVHARRIIKKVEVFEPVLKMVLAGFNYIEIAKELSLSRREVELTVGYIEEFFHARGFAA